MDKLSFAAPSEIRQAREPILEHNVVFCFPGWLMPVTADSLSTSVVGYV